MTNSRWLHSGRLLALLLAPALIALAAGPGFSAEATPAFMQRLYPPELVMKNHRRIELSGEQRTSITQAIKATQATTLELSWSMQDAAADLTRAMTASQIDRAEALKAAERMMGVEGQVKRAHLGLLITIKNALTVEQQRKLDQIRAGAD